MLRIQKNAERVLRSAAQATDSTRKGCRANSAAAIALGQNAPVIKRMARKRSTAAAAWISGVDQVMAAGPGAENLPVGHVRKPRQRVPISQVIGPDPLEPIDRQPLDHLGVFIDVIVVVADGELMRNHLSEGDQHEDEQANADACVSHGGTRGSAGRGAVGGAAGWGLAKRLLFLYAPLIAD